MKNPEPTPATETARRVLESEKRLLGGLMHAQADHEAVWANLQPTDFVYDAHQSIGYTLREMWASRIPIDLTTVCVELEKSGRMEKSFGEHGFEYVAELFANAGTSAMNEYHAKEIRDAARLRELLFVAIEIQRDCSSPVASTDETIDAAAAKIFALSERTTKTTRLQSSAEATNAAMVRIDKRQRREIEVGISTGLSDLDRIIGSIPKRELTILAARPSVGKTAFAHQVGRHAAANGYGTLFASLEQATEELGIRALSAQSKVEGQVLQLGLSMSSYDVGRLSNAADQLRSLKFHYDDTPGQNSLHILATARRLKKSHGLDFVIVDYLQLIPPDDSRSNRNDQIDVITRRLREMARELDVAVLCLSQLSRECEKQGRRPRLSDLRDSGSIEQHAGTVMILHRPTKGMGETDPIELGIEKQRNGPTGYVSLAYRRSILTFESAEMGIPE